jgi:hypothetical protein
MTALLGTQQIKALVAKSSEVLGGSPIVRQIIRVLCLLHSSDEDLHDLGYGWLLGQGLESSEAAELKLTNTRGMSYNYAEIVKGLSWLMAQRAPRSGSSRVSPTNQGPVYARADVVNRAGAGASVVESNPSLAKFDDVVSKAVQK